MAPSAVYDSLLTSSSDDISLVDLNEHASSKANQMTPEKEVSILKCKGIRRSLFTVPTDTPKRRLSAPEATYEPCKRRRVSHPQQMTRRHELSPMSEIIYAVDKMTTNSDLVADASRQNVLPTIKGKHSDVNSISPQTLCDVISGQYDSSIDDVTIIDCRYPYEYNGGHIEGAVNLYTKDMIQKFLHETSTNTSTVHVLVFHCEFSSKRGPKLYRFLRSLDRDLNKEYYPKLNFPEIYLLEGGYKAFFETCKSQCEPQSYLPMLHENHTAELRHFRVKSKSWTAGEKHRLQTENRGVGTRLTF